MQGPRLPHVSSFCGHRTEGISDEQGTTSDAVRLKVRWLQTNLNTGSLQRLPFQLCGGLPSTGDPPGKPPGPGGHGWAKGH